MRRSLPSSLRCVASLAGFVALGACDNWPVQRDAGVGGGEVTPPATRDASALCLIVAPVIASSAPQVNGALCFGIALGSSAALECAPSSTLANSVLCADSLLGTAFEVRWTGTSGAVFSTRNRAPLGSLTALESAKFDIDITAGQSAEGVCTFETVPQSRATFCPYE